MQEDICPHFRPNQERSSGTSSIAPWCDIDGTIAPYCKTEQHKTCPTYLLAHQLQDATKLGEKSIVPIRKDRSPYFVR